MRIFVTCPAHLASGGTHALHQLVHTARSLGAEAHIVYYGARPGESPTPPRFAHYDVAEAPAVVDESDCVVITPEIDVSRLLSLTRARPVLWWLSVFYFEQHAQRVWDALKTPADPWGIVYTHPRMLHLAQSKYAADHVRSHGGTSLMVTDYAPQSLIDRLQANGREARRPVIAYNPAKGLELTEQVMRSAPDLEWVALEGMDPDEVADELRRASVYVDLGFHPGRDRIPREAAIAGAVVVVGRRGSADNPIDVPLDDAYKVSTMDFDAGSVADLLRTCISDHARHSQAQESYRQWCLAQESIFIEETKQLLEVLTAAETEDDSALPSSADATYEGAESTAAQNSRPAASIVIPAWNAVGVTQACLATLVPTLRSDDQVIVVDNGSSDLTPDLLAGWRDRIEAVRLPSNQGFAAGCNAGARLADNPIVVYLNNDTLPHGDWLDRLLKPFSDPTVGATGPMSNFVSGSQLHHSFRQQVRNLRDVERLASTAMAQGGRKVRETHRLVGFCLAVRTDIVRELGGFDEAFGIGGYEDDDLSNRIGRAGFRLLVVEGSYVFHIGHATFDANGLDWAAIELQNRSVMERKQHAAPPVSLSIVLCCGDDLVETARPLLQLLEITKGPAAQLLLLDNDTGTAQALQQEISGGDVVVLDATTSLQQALDRCSGKTKVILECGRDVDAHSVVAFLNDPERSGFLLDLRLPTAAAV